MKKKLDTRFPAARIKKIMQTDEDIGKIAMAVPLLMSKALEHFLQDLCNRTYDITQKKGAKTLNSSHLKQCVQTCNVFDFLKDVVRKVPDLGDHAATDDDRTITKKRKLFEESENNSDDKTRKNKMPELGHSGSRVRVRGRGRGRRRRQGSRKADKETIATKFEDTRSDDSEEDLVEPEEVKETVSLGKKSEVFVRNFDLNMDLDENGELPAITTAMPVDSPANMMTELKHESSPANMTTEFKNEEIPEWSFSYVENVDIDPMQLVNLHRRLDEDDEDYDEES